ncbi:MAG: hypothetical protein Kow00107_06000 [Planctomycetota bacterium]
MRTYYCIAAAAALLMFVLLQPAAFAAPNPGDTTNVKSPSGEEEKKAPQPKAAESSGKSIDWLDVRVSLAYGYDSNVVLLNDDLDIVDDYDTSKIVTTVTLRADFGEASKWKFGGQYDFFNAFHDEVDYMEIQSHSILFYGFYRSAPHYLYIPLSGNLYLLDNTTYLYTVRLMPTYYFEQRNNLLLSIMLGSELLNYKELDDRPYDAMDYHFRISETYMFSRDMWVKGALGYNYFDANGDHNSYSGPKFLIDFHSPLFWRIQLDLGFSFQYRDYRKVDPTDLKARVDRRYILGAKLTREIDWGFSAFVSYNYIENSSNVDRYRYSRNVLLVGVEWNY